MNFFKFLLYIVIATAASNSFAQKINPITQAMLDGYAQILSDNPNDYFTLYQRAQQYYQLSEYDKALTDAKKAISLTPNKDKELLADEWQLCADIYIQTQNFSEALFATDNALSYRPESYSILYQKGNICLYMQNADEAKKSFLAMQRMKSRSQEAYFGLAKVAIMQNDIPQAEAFMKEAENCDPSNYITYCRLGDLSADMKNYNNAAVHYLSAFSLSAGKDRPLKSLLKIAKIDYDRTIDAIDFAISKTSNVVPMYFLKGNIALQNNRFTDAYDAFRHLEEIQTDDTDAIYVNLAYICHALDQQDDALKYANKALIANPSVENNILKAKIELASGNINNALIYAKNALAKNPISTDAMIMAANAYIALKQYDEAIEILNDAIINDAENTLPLMLRAFAFNTSLDNRSKAIADYARVIKTTPTSPQLMAYKAIAQTISGKKLDGDQTIENLISMTPDDAESLFYAAIYFAQTGALERAKSSIDKAIELGFENEFLLHKDNTANLNLAPIRHLLK